MKILTTDPLWTWAIFEGIRLIENRGDPLEYCGPMLVHASESMRQTPFIRDWIRRETLYLPPDDELLAAEYRGRIVGEVDMIGCVPVGEVLYREREFAVGPYCLRLRNPRQFVYPIPWTDCVDLSDVQFPGVVQ